jgi:hypothetical protein
MRMPTIQSPDIKPIGLFSRLSTWIILCALTMVACIVMLGYWYQQHLEWMLMASRDPQLRSVRAVSTFAMPDSPAPVDWVHCRFGLLEFAVPPAFAENASAKVGKSGGGFFILSDGRETDKQIKILISQPDEINEAEPPLINIPSPRLGRELSWIDLQLAVYQVDSNDFQWSMSPDEAAWFNWRIRMRTLFGGGPQPSSIETVYRDDLNGLLEFFPLVTSFECRTKDGKLSTVCNFFVPSDTSPWIKKDPHWIRRFCQSLKIDGNTRPVPAPKSEEELLSLFEVISR